MSRDKQIEEMAWLKCCCHSSIKGICGVDGKPCDLDCGSYREAEALYNAGYRKSQEVAREIFEEINDLRDRYAMGDMEYPDFQFELGKIEKKYTEGKDTNVPTSPKDEFAKMLSENWKWGEEP